MKRLRNMLENLVIGGICAVRDCVDGVGAVHGNGIIRERTENFDAVSELTVEGPWEVQLQCGALTDSCRIAAEENLMEFIVMERVGDHLYFRLSKSMILTQALQLDLHLKHLPEKINESGSCRMKMANVNGASLCCKVSGHSRFKIAGGRIDEVKFKISGASKVKCALTSARGDITVSGASKAVFSGMVQALDADVSGASKLEVNSAGQAEIAVSGNSKLVIDATQSLEGCVAGASQLKYSGVENPSIRVSGASALKRKRTEKEKD